MPRLSELHYFEVELGEAADELRPALFQGVHGFNESHADELGLDFSGTAVRVFGARDPLLAFFAQPRTQRMVAVCERLTGPAPVPACSEAVVVKRSRQATRNQPARLRRFERRNPGVELRTSKTVRCSLAVPLSSKSTGQAFLLKLDRTSAELTPEVRFNSYGLCAPGSSLPLF